MQDRYKRGSFGQLRTPWEITLGRSLQDLDGEAWNNPAFDSHLVTTCHSLKLKPIGSLTDEELRMAIGQGIGLEWLIRLGIERLKEDPLRSGDFYEGDLLKQIVGVPIDFWASHSSERKALDGIVGKLAHDPRLNGVVEEVRRAISVYQAKR